MAQSSSRPTSGVPASARSEARALSRQFMDSFAVKDADPAWTLKSKSKA